VPGELSVSDEAQEWRWVGEDGVEKAVTEHELIAELSSEALPHYTLVWKKRWLEWLPAMQVAELGWALPPGRAERAVKARESATAAQPPAPPLYLYPVIKRRAGNALAATRSVKGPDSSPFEDVELDAVAKSNPTSVSDDVTDVGDGDGDLVVSDAFETAGATRTALGARAYSDDDDGETHILPSRPPPLGAVYVGPHTPPPSEAPGPTYDENEIPHIPRPPGSPRDLSAYARQSPDSDVELELEPSEPPPRPMRPLVLACGAVALGIGAALLLLHGIEVTGRAAAVEAPSASAGSPGSASSAVHPTSAMAAMHPRKEDDHPQGTPCTVATPALRVADWAEPLVPPMLAAIPGSGRLAVGFAQSDSYAIGMTLDPRTLDRDQVFREYRKEKLVSVVPTSGSGKLRFDIVRQGYPLVNARVVDAATPFALGATPFSVARIGKTSEPVTLWSFADAEQSTMARVIETPTKGYAVALRRGGKNGPVSVGYLDAAGNKQSELSDVRADGAPGTPSLATDETSLLVAFALKSSPSAPFGISAGTSPLGEAPRRTAKLVLRDGGPGGDRMAPSVGALGGGRWFVEWSEGSAGNRMARAQVFDQKLTPLTEAVNLSPDGANAGPGVVWTSGDLATVLFYVKNDKSNNELWGVSLECAR